jgi:(p)ppGpp synthase/HD superfamily hydrolase
MQPSSPGINDFSKATFARLLKYFENIEDVVKLTRALGLAAKAYKQQVINKNEPYINHALRITLILAEELHIQDVELLCAALLHAASKTALTDADIKNEVGERVYSIIYAFHEPKADTEQTAMEYFSTLAKAPKDIRYIKLAERLDEVRSMKGQMFKDKVLRYKEETQKYVMPIASATDDNLAFKLSVALYELK